MTDFRKALLWTAIPLVALALIGMVSMPVWIVALALVVIAFIVALILLLAKHNRQAAAGVFTGFAIGIVALGATCFAAFNKLG